MCNSSVDVDGLACVSVGIETVSMNDERAIEYAQTIMRLANTLKLSNLLVSVFYVCICVCACMHAYTCLWALRAFQSTTNAPLQG